MYDVIVVGGGSMGIAAAYYKGKTGADVLVLDKYEIPNTMGSHHGMTRMLRMNYGHGSSYVPLVQESLKLWRELEVESEKELFKETGCITIGHSSSEFIDLTIESAKHNQIPYQTMNAEQIMAEWQGISIPHDYKGVYDPAAGFLFSEECLAAYKEAARLQGVDIHENEGVLNIENHENGDVAIHTEKDTYYAKKVIVTAGAWLNKLLPEIELPIQPVRKTISWFKPSEENLYDRHFPCFAFDIKEEGLYYGFPDYEGYGVKVGRMDNDIPCDPDDMNRTYGAFDQDENDVRYLLERYIPKAAGRLIDGKVSMFSRTPDDDFIIDVHPSNPNIVLAGGFSGHGFKFASVIGAILADLSVDGTTDRDISPFTLSRFMSE